MMAWAWKCRLLFLLIKHKDENIGIDGNIKGQKYGNIGGNIWEISISIKPWKKWWKFIKKMEIFNETLRYAYLLYVLSIQQ